MIFVDFHQIKTLYMYVCLSFELQTGPYLLGQSIIAQVIYVVEW